MNLEFARYMVGIREFSVPVTAFKFAGLAFASVPGEFYSTLQPRGVAALCYANGYYRYIADKNAYVRNGDIIIGMDGDEATVKRLEKLGDGTVVFMPENEDFDPIYPENPSVLGKVIGSYRKY